LAEAAMALFREDMLYSDIAEELGVDRHLVKGAVEEWHRRNGLPLPIDGRSRRGQLPRCNRQAPLFERIARTAKELYDEGKLIEEIAAELKCDRTTVRSALKFWHESRGLTMTDGRNRRKSLALKNRPKAD